MEKHLFTVYDSAAGAYLDPFVAPSIEFAIREFKSAVNKENHQFNRYPEDYTLFHIGQFSQADGKLIPSDPRSLGVAITFVTPSQQLNLIEETNKETNNG